MSIEKLYGADKLALSWDVRETNCTLLSHFNDFYGQAYRDNTVTNYNLAKILYFEDGMPVLEFSEAKPSPYPIQNMKVDLFTHVNEATRVWAISQCGKYTFAKSDRFWGYCGCFQIDKSKSREGRIALKNKAGFQFVDVANYIAADKIFI